MRINTKPQIQLLLGTVFLTFCLLSCKTKEKDYSLSLDEYEKLGMPIPNQPWDSEEFLNANDVLSKFKWENPGQLPKKGSEKSGALFDWFITLENLTFLFVDTLRLNEKRPTNSAGSMPLALTSSSTPCLLRLKNFCQRLL